MPPGDSQSMALSATRNDSATTPAAIAIVVGRGIFVGLLSGILTGILIGVIFRSRIVPPDWIQAIEFTGRGESAPDRRRDREQPKTWLRRALEPLSTLR